VHRIVHPSIIENNPIPVNCFSFGEGEGRAIYRQGELSVSHGSIDGNFDDEPIVNKLIWPGRIDDR